MFTCVIHTCRVTTHLENVELGELQGGQAEVGVNGVLLTMLGNALRVVQEASGQIRLALTTTSHLLI